MSLDISRYWSKRLSRRRVIATSTAGGLGLAAASMIGCGGGNGNGSGAQTDSGSQKAAPYSLDKAQSGGTLKAITTYDVDTLDPIVTKSFRTNVIASYVYSRLFKFKPGINQRATGEVEGDAVEKWENPDDTTLILHLRQGMKFDPRPPTNGRPLVAEDVVSTYQKYAADSAYKTDLVNSVNKAAPITSLRAIDSSSIEIKTAFPDATLLSVLAFAFDIHVLPKEAYSGGFDPNTEVRGTGPWTLTSYKPSVSWSFAKNPNYYGAPKLPLMDAIEMPIITDTAQAEAQFKAKNVWWGAVAATDIVSFKKELPDTHIDLGGPSAGGPALSFSWRPNQPFKDVRVRRALSMLIDRDAFIDTFFDVENFKSIGVTLGSYWNTPLGAGFGDYWLDPKDDKKFGTSNQYLKLNVAQAKQLLSAAGFANGMQIQLTTLAGTQYGRDWSQRAEAFAAMMAKGGVEVKINAVDYTSVWVPSFLRSHGDFDGIAMYPNGVRADPGQWLSVFYHSAGANNQTANNFPELDAMIEKQGRELDRTRRISLFADIQRYMVENMISIPQGGDADATGLTWNGLHGPGQVFIWAGNTYSAGGETWPLFWAEKSLKGG
jgi:peptide/nickel transport system substrate-binding protein